MKRATFLFLAMTTVFVGQSLAQQPLAAEQITNLARENLRMRVVWMNRGLSVEK